MDFNPKVVFLLIVWAAVGIWIVWTVLQTKKEGEIVIVLTSQPTRIVVVNSVVGRKVAEYLTAAWTAKLGNSTPAKAKRLSAAYQQLVMSGLDADTLRAVLNEADAPLLKTGVDRVDRTFIGKQSLPSRTTSSDVVIGVAALSCVQSAFRDKELCGE